MASILDNISDLITPATLARASAATGDSEAALSTGLGAVIPAILGALSKRSNETGFMTELGRLALRGADADPLAAAKSFLTPSTNAIDTTTPMGGWLSGLFGHNLTPVTDAVARYAGLRAGSAASLLSLGASLVLGYLGRLMRSDQLDATGLASRLRAEQASFAAAIPRGFDLPRVAGEDVRRHVEAARAPQPDAGSWVVPLLLTVLGLGALGWFANRFRPEGTVARIEDTATKAVGTAGTIAGDWMNRVLPGSMSIRIPAGGMEDRLVSYVASPSATGSNVFNFDRIGFTSGSSTLTAESKEQIDNVAAILRAYPLVRVTVGGHSDNVGSSSANMELSKARAEAVADALARSGVSADRVQPEGYGNTKPIADNSTEAGRALNRRVTVEVTSR